MELTLRKKNEKLLGKIVKNSLIFFIIIIFLYFRKEKVKIFFFFKKNGPKMICREIRGTVQMEFVTNKLGHKDPIHELRVTQNRW